MNDYQYTQHKLQVISSERHSHLKTMNDVQQKLIQDKALLHNLSNEMTNERKNELIKNIANNEARLPILNRVMDVLNELFDEATTLFNNYK